MTDDPDFPVLLAAARDEILIRVERGNGTIETDWTLCRVDIARCGLVLVSKPHPRPSPRGDLWVKRISLDRLYALNPELRESQTLT
jgi:hypothetical protein